MPPNRIQTPPLRSVSSVNLVTPCSHPSPLKVGLIYHRKLSIREMYLSHPMETHQPPSRVLLHDPPEPPLINRQKGPSPEGLCFPYIILQQQLIVSHSYIFYCLDLIVDKPHLGSFPCFRGVAATLPWAQSQSWEHGQRTMPPPVPRAAKTLHHAPWHLPFHPSPDWWSSFHCTCGHLSVLESTTLKHPKVIETTVSTPLCLPWSYQAERTSTFTCRQTPLVKGIRCRCYPSRCDLAFRLWKPVRSHLAMITLS